MYKNLSGQVMGDNAVNRARQNNEHYYYRANGGRWYVMCGKDIVFGEGLQPAHLEDCQMWMRSVEIVNDRP